jgi:hypothetical protein
VAAGTATAVRNRVTKRQAERWAEQEGGELPPEPAAPQALPPAGAPAAPQESDIEQLKQLAQLKEQGILTEEEFAAQKAKILGGG